MQNRMKWFLDARFGMFIHWGLYSMLGGHYNGQETPAAIGEWIMRHMRIPFAEYSKLAETFDPVRWDAEAVVRLCRDSGMKYLTFTSKHHDGFAMYDSKVSDYNIMHTPFGRDVLKELAHWCKEYGITLCIYYSQMQDWEDPDGNGNDWDFDPAKKDFEAYFRRKVIPQVTELLQNYGPVGMMWFDTPYDMPEPLCRELKELVRSLQPDCIINGRIGYGLGDYLCAGDNCMPTRPWKTPWELPMTLNHTWGYRPDDIDWKSSGEVIEALTQAVGKGGNLLLNIGPDPLGQVPEESARILRKVGEWMARCGESIYSAGAAPEFPYQLPWGAFTMKDDILYMHLLRRPKHRDLEVYGFLTEVLSIRDLRTGEAIPFSAFFDQARSEKRLILHLPGELPSGTVLKIELAGPMRTASAPV
ncbi:MAG: alpha-L-fucosidase [Oscillospiraceae bacterium]|nr:alpha-L-fucosidase [Oscillospiraceae bacterium]